MCVIQPCIAVMHGDGSNQIASSHDECYVRASTSGRICIKTSPLLDEFEYFLWWIQVQISPSFVTVPWKKSHAALRCQLAVLQNCGSRQSIFDISSVQQCSFYLRMLKLNWSFTINNVTIDSFICVSLHLI